MSLVCFEDAEVDCLIRGLGCRLLLLRHNRQIMLQHIRQTRCWLPKRYQPCWELGTCVRHLSCDGLAETKLRSDAFSNEWIWPGL